MKVSTTKKHDTAKYQMGFFDLGFSLALLALSGSFAYTTTSDQDDKVAVQEPQLEVVASLDAGNEVADIFGREVRMRRVDAGDAGLPHAPVTAIRGDDAKFNAAALKDLLDGASILAVDSVDRAVLIN